MDLGLQNKSVIVMASSKGLGKATAMQFAVEVAHVFITSRNEKELEKTKLEIQQNTGNEHVEYVVCDITKPDSIKQLITEVV
ncbi:SDR family NAD(P)-dependent oxidoreductase [Terrihalobacillus insolitus]|uniref:SDR family NAD(P)-dependent oxidoreductase n=1 Tax=Terrihalobacillus insolitus TaxID=2950438 RepID=UPI003A910FD9